MESRATVLVRASIADSKLTPAEVARRAGVSPSTVHRILNGHVSPAVDTVEEIVTACGLQLHVTSTLPSDPDAAAGARFLLDESYQGSGPRLEAWADRLERWGSDDPIAIVTAAAAHAGLTRRAGAVHLRGSLSMGRLASAGTASEQRWAMSGAAGLSLPRFDHAVPAVSVLWCQDPRRIHQLLNSDHVTEATAPHRANLIIAAADPHLFDGAFENDRIVYAAPIQIAIDSLSIEGPTADAALKEISTW